MAKDFMGKMADSHDAMKQGTPLQLLRWKCHTPNLLKESLHNPGMDALRIPFAQFGRMLHEVAERASQLHDKRLDAMMMGLTLYEIADPEHPKFNKTMVEAYTKFLIENPVDKAPSYADLVDALDKAIEVISAAAKRLPNIHLILARELEADADSLRHTLNKAKGE